MDEAAKMVETKGNAPESKLSVRVSNLPFELKDDGVELKKHFTSQCGKVKTMTLKKMTDGRFKGIAIFLFKSEEAAEKAIACNGEEFAGRELRVARLGINAEKKPPPAPNKELKVTVSNLPFKGTDRDELTKYFSSKCGELGNLRMKQTANGSPKGFAIIRFSSKEAVEKAIACNGEEFAGRKMKVRRMAKESEDKAPKAPTGNLKKRPASNSGDKKQPLKDAEEEAAAEDSHDSDVDVVATKETAKASAEASKPAEESDDSDVDVAAAKGGAKEATTKAQKTPPKKKFDKAERKAHFQAEHRQAQFSVRVSNLSFSTQDDGELRKYFSSHCGEVKALSLKKRQDGRCRGVAVVMLGSKEAVEKAIACDGVEFGGRKVRVQNMGPQDEASENPNRNLKRKSKSDGGEDKVGKLEQAEDAPAKKKPRKDSEGQAESDNAGKRVSMATEAEEAPSKKKPKRKGGLKQTKKQKEANEKAIDAAPKKKKDMSNS